MSVFQSTSSPTVSWEQDTSFVSWEQNAFPTISAWWVNDQIVSSVSSIRSLLSRFKMSTKFSAFGLFLWFLSLVLPWWSRTSFTAMSTQPNSIETVNAFQWPLYLSGMILFAIFLILLFVLILDMLGKKIPKYDLSHEYFYFHGGVWVAVLSIISFSAYAHPLFTVVTRQMTSGVSYGAYVGLFAGLILITAGISEISGRKL